MTKQPNIFYFRGHSYCIFFVGFGKHITKEVYHEWRYDTSYCSLKSIMLAKEMMNDNSPIDLFRHAVYVNQQPFLSLKSPTEFEVFEIIYFLGILIVKFKKSKL